MEDRLARLEETCQAAVDVYDSLVALEARVEMVEKLLLVVAEFAYASAGLNEYNPNQHYHRDSEIVLKIKKNFEEGLTFS